MPLQPLAVSVTEEPAQFGDEALLVRVGVEEIVPLMVTDCVYVQSYLSVTVTEYVPGAKLLIVWVVAPVFHK